MFLNHFSLPIILWSVSVFFAVATILKRRLECRQRADTFWSTFLALLSAAAAGFLVIFLVIDTFGTLASLGAAVAALLAFLSVTVTVVKSFDLAEEHNDCRNVYRMLGVYFFVMGLTLLKLLR